MLTPLPLPPSSSPVTPGPHVLAHGLGTAPGAETAQALHQAATAALPARAGPHPAATPEALPLPGAEILRPTAQPATSTALPFGETALATASVPQGGSAAPMSLVAAQMIGVETAPLQALLAQQAASRALPHGPHRRAEPATDAPPEPTTHTPDDSFDPHAPHPPQVFVPHHAAATARPDRGPDHAEDDDSSPPGAHAQPRPAPHPPPLHPPPLDRPRLSSPWLVAGAVFTGIVVLAVLAI